MSYIRALRVRLNSTRENVGLQIDTFDPLDSYDDPLDSKPPITIDVEREIWAETAPGNRQFHEFGASNSVNLEKGGIVTVFDVRVDAQLEAAAKYLKDALQLQLYNLSAAAR